MAKRSHLTISTFLKQENLYQKLPSKHFIISPSLPGWSLLLLAAREAGEWLAVLVLLLEAGKGEGLWGWLMGRSLTVSNAI